MITHKFREVAAFADEVTSCGTGASPAAAGSPSSRRTKWRAMMIGARKLTAQPPRVGEPGAGRLEIRRSSRSATIRASRPVRICRRSVRGGEIVGVAGVSGNGQKELVEVLAGQRQRRAGEIRVERRRPTCDPRRNAPPQAVLLPEEPLQNACVAADEVAENLAFRELRPRPSASRRHLDHYGPIEDYAARRRRRNTSIKTALARRADRGALRRQCAAGRAGARARPASAEILIVANPCFGLDFSAVAEIRARIMAARNLAPRSSGLARISTKSSNYRRPHRRHVRRPAGLRDPDRRRRPDRDRPPYGGALPDGEIAAARPFPTAFIRGRRRCCIIDMQRDFVEPGGFGESLGNDVSRARRRSCRQ